jgi:V8-like Glu-specific endopeptidase
MTEPMPSSEWASEVEGVEARRDESRHEFPPRPEVVAVTQSDFDERAAAQTEHDGYRPEDAPLRPLPELLRPERFGRPSWRRQAGRQDDLGEPSTVFPPDTRSVIYDTAYPWRTCGRVGVPGGWGSGVMIGRRHMMTASHVVPWLAGGGSDWMTFTPMQYDTSTPFGSAYATRVYYWERANPADGIDSNEAAFDYVVVVLSTALGDSTGWMGSRAYSSNWNGQVLWAHIGYPSDIGSGVRPVYTTNGVMDSTVSETTAGRNSFRIMHRNDVKTGQSGGPYFGWWSGEDFPRMIGSQSAENWGFAGGPNAAGGGDALPQLIIYATGVEP